MTERLFWADAYRREFDAQVMVVEEYHGQPALELDKTCFYATSGGQPHDTGTLNSVRVLDVVEDEGRILHLLSEPLRLGPAHGVIDWSRRFDHMQQHSGQHILSQAWLRLAGAETVSFHLGADTCTIDIAIASAPSSLVEAVEDYANQVIWDDAPVYIREYQPDELASVALRKQPVVTGAVRVVQIGDFDMSACGGTHVQRTGEVGSIHIIGCEKRRGMTRVEFMCGSRALRSQRLARQALQASALRLSIHPLDVPGAIERLMDENQSAQKRVDELRTRLLQAEILTWLENAESVHGWRVICRQIGYPAPLIRQAAQALVAHHRTCALLASEAPAVQFCFANSEESAISMDSLLRQALQAFGGKGGGSMLLAQGGGVPDEAVPAVLSAARTVLEGVLSSQASAGIEERGAG